MKTCETCKHWIAWKSHRNSGHQCQNSKLIADGRFECGFGQYKTDCGEDELFYPYDEGIPFFETGKNFGCVHHEEKKKYETDPYKTFGVREGLPTMG